MTSMLPSVARMSVQLGLSVWTELPLLISTRTRPEQTTCGPAKQLAIDIAERHCAMHTRASGSVMLVSSSNLLPQNRKQGAKAPAIILDP